MLKKMKKVMQVSITFVVMLVLLMSVPFPTLASSKFNAIENVKIVVNGQQELEAITVHKTNGRLYVPVGSIVPILDGAVKWDTVAREATVTNKLGETIVIGEAIPTLQFNEHRYKLEEEAYIDDSRLYVPARHLVELLHGDIIWDQEAATLTLHSLALAEVSDESSIAAISEQYQLDKQQLLSRNGYKHEDEVQVGAKLAYIVPSILSHKAKSYTDEEYGLLAKIVQVESGYEDYEGQLAVANVILNRVKDKRFPSTIKDVIYSGKQFPPAHNGKLDKAKPNKSVLKAVEDALNGKNNVEDAVYFYNPKVTKGKFWSSLETVSTIGSHRFAK